MNKYYVYDLECYPNIFTFCGKFEGDNNYQLFEISDRRNDVQELVKFLWFLKSDPSIEMVGWNTLAYDYLLLHEILMNPYVVSFQKLFDISQSIIHSQRGDRGFSGISVENRIIPQIDIFKFCHFDNKAKSTSLKALQFNMRVESLEDLPFDIRALNDQEKDELRSYNLHDVVVTEEFFKKVKHALDMRREFLNDGILKGDVLNFSDVKIGSEYIVNRIGKYKCFAGGKPRQSIRTVIDFKTIILPKIYFRTELFNSVLSWFYQQQIILRADERPKLEIKLAGLDFHFGVGGVHASADNKIFYTDDEYQIYDVDVSGMYPAVAIANRFAPEHLGDSFVEVYKQIKEDRAKYAKGTSRSAVLKLAANGTYGNSNNPFSPMYDPKFTFSVTVNGQLQILQLVELIDLIPGCELIQANTDGITVRVRKEYEYLFKLWTTEWEKMTGLELEFVKYNRMWIRDVNNYIAEKMDASLKRKGAYFYPIEEKDYDGWWHKDFSNIASIKAAEKAMTHNWPVEVAIKLVTDPFDFMLRYKATGDSKIYIGDKKQLKTVRYYVSSCGQPMKKFSSPKGEMGEYKRKNGIKDSLYDSVMKEIGKGVWDDRIHTKNKSKYEVVEQSIESGRLVEECNIATKFNWNNVDWDYYITEAKKIIIGSK